MDHQNERSIVMNATGYAKKKSGIVENPLQPAQYSSM